MQVVLELYKVITSNKVLSLRKKTRSWLLKSFFLLKKKKPSFNERSQLSQLAFNKIYYFNISYMYSNNMIVLLNNHRFSCLIECLIELLKQTNLNQILKTKSPWY